MPEKAMSYSFATTTLAHKSCEYVGYLTQQIRAIQPECLSCHPASIGKFFGITLDISDLNTIQKTISRPCRPRPHVSNQSVGQSRKVILVANLSGLVNPRRQAHTAHHGVTRSPPAFTNWPVQISLGHSPCSRAALSYFHPSGRPRKDTECR